MKMDKAASSQNDEFYTPEYAIKPILKYIKMPCTVWCPFDTEESNFVKLLSQYAACGVSVIHSHIATGGECSSDIRKQVADVYAATCGSFMSIGCDVCPTLMARDYKQSHIVCYKDGGTENDYV